MQTPGTIFREHFAQKAAANGSIEIDGSKKKRRDQTKARIFLVACVFLVVYGAIGTRLATLAIASANNVEVTAKIADNKLMIARPDLVDRNGDVLAKDLNTYSLHANPQKIIYPEEALDQLTEILPDLNREVLLKRLRGKGKFVWIKRELTPSQRAQIFDLGIPGLQFDRETRRFYPGGPTASHLVGYVDIDNQGIAGFEKFVDDHWLNDLRAVGFGSNERMEPVALSIDMRVQHVVRDELKKAMENYKAIAAIGIIMDADTGEVVAMSSLPDYDPNNLKDTFSKDAMALDSGKVSMHDSFDARKPIQHGRFKIRDFHAKKRILSVPEVFIYSSNIGTAKMAEAVGIDGHKGFLERLGLMKPSVHELPEVGRPQAPKVWNGGKLIPPTFRPRSIEEANEVGTRVVSEETSHNMRYLFRLNVEEGSGRRAEVEGYAVGGKTGTAEKVVNGKYSAEKKLNSFLSAKILQPLVLMLHQQRLRLFDEWRLHWVFRRVCRMRFQY